MRLNAFFPSLDIGTDPIKIRDWAQAAEDLGYAYIEVPDQTKRMRFTKLSMTALMNRTRRSSTCLSASCEKNSPMLRAVRIT
jgi:hypothetical protein